MEADEEPIDFRIFIAHQLQNFLGEELEQDRELDDLSLGAIDYEFEQHKMPKINKKPDLKSFTVTII